MTFYSRFWYLKDLYVVKSFFLVGLKFFIFFYFYFTWRHIYICIHMYINILIYVFSYVHICVCTLYIYENHWWLNSTERLIVINGINSKNFRNISIKLSKVFENAHFNYCFHICYMLSLLH